jgi:hypothetical protein
VSQEPLAYSLPFPILIGQVYEICAVGVLHSSRNSIQVVQHMGYLFRLGLAPEPSQWALGDLSELSHSADPRRMQFHALRTPSSPRTGDLHCQSQMMIPLGKVRDLQTGASKTHVWMRLSLWRVSFFSQTSPTRRSLSFVPTLPSYVKAVPLTFNPCFDCLPKSVVACR